MLQDQIKHCLIRANELTRQKQDVKYIVSQLFAAVKLMFEASKECKLDTVLVHKVMSRYEQFDCEFRDEIASLEQIHQHMLEEIKLMLECEQFRMRSKLKKTMILSSNNLLLSSKYIPREEEIVLTEEIQHYGDAGSDVSIMLDNRQATFYPPLISLQAVPSFAHKQQECEQMREAVQTLYGEHKLDQAYQLCQKYKSKLTLANPNQELSNLAKALTDRINGQYELMTYYYQFFDEPGYILDKQDQNVRMYYKMNEQKKEVSVKVDAELDISIEVFVSIVSEIDLFQDYIPFSYDTKMLKSLARNQKVGTTKVWLPLLDDRQAYFYAAAYDRLATNHSIFFYSKTIASDLHFQNKIGYKVVKNPNYIELEYRFYIMEYIPLSPARGRIRLATNVNMGLNFLPLFVINKSCRIFAFDYFKNLMEVNKKFKGSKWQKKMKQNPDFYSFFRNRIQEYLSQLK